MCLSPKIGEEKNFFQMQKKSNIPKNYSKKNISKLTTSKNQFSRNPNNKTKQSINSSRKIVPNHISINSTSNNSSYKNLPNNQKNQVFIHKKSESSINFLSFMNQNISPNTYNQKQLKYNIININDGSKINNSFMNDISNKENKDFNSKEILINKNNVKNNKIIKRNNINKNKCYKITNSKKSPNNNTTTYGNFNNISKNKIGDKKIIINLANSPRNKNNINNKNHYYSKNISPTGSRNIVLKSPSNVVVDKNPIIKTIHKKSQMEKYNTDTYNIKKNKNFSGNMFAIHKIFENNLFCNKMKEKIRKNNLYKKINYRKNEKNEICFGHTMSHSYNKNCKNKNNLSNNSLNIPSNLIFFSSNKNNSDKNCLYKSKYNKCKQKSKESFSSNKNENEINKTYNYNNDKKNEFINIYNINSINKFDNSLYLKIENNFKNVGIKDRKKEKEKFFTKNILAKENKTTINDNNEGKNINKFEIIYNNRDKHNDRMNKEEDYTPEETHFQVISFIQSIKSRNKNYF